MAQPTRPRRPWEEGTGSQDVANTISRPLSQDENPTRHLLPQLPTSSNTKLFSLPKLYQNAHTPRQPSVFQSLLSPGAIADTPVDLMSDQTSTTSYKPSLKRRRTLDYSESLHTDRGSRNSLDSIMTSSASKSKDATRCCDVVCHGDQCTAIRQIISTLESELALHEVLVHGNACENRAQEHSLHSLPLPALLEQVCNRLQQSNQNLKSLLQSNTTTKPPTPALGPSSPVSRRGSIAINPESPTPAGRNSPSVPPSARSRLQSSSHQPPSPVSLNISIPASHPASMTLGTTPISPSRLGPPPLPSLSAAQQAHLQDLQHQISVKTLAYTTLSKEYDLLFQKLSRQRVKCATLERKFEVSDAEIISLANDKERLEDKVTGLEKQMAKLEKERDDVRKTGNESKDQWMRIVEMAGKLHGGSSAAEINDQDWPQERTKLQQRIAELEKQISSGDQCGDAMATSSTTPTSRLQTLEKEISQLRERNSRLESGLVAAKQAALNLAAQGQNVGAVLSKALRED